MDEQANVRVVEGMFSSLERGDIQGVLDRLSDDVEWRIAAPSELPYAGVHRGRDEVARFFRSFGQAAEFEMFEPQEYLARGNKVVVLGHERQRIKASGQVVETDWAMAFVFARRPDHPVPQLCGFARRQRRERRGVKRRSSAGSPQGPGADVAGVVGFRYARAWSEPPGILDHAIHRTSPRSRCRAAVPSKRNIPHRADTDSRSTSPRGDAGRDDRLGRYPGRRGHVDFRQPAGPAAQGALWLRADAGLDRRVRSAAVRFNSGGSGAFVSPDGLVMTNHHVAADTLQKISTPAKDYYKEGFLARTRDEEVKAPDLELNVLVDIRDVTDRVNAAVSAGMDDASAAKARRQATATIEKESFERTGLRSDVVTLYRGGRYHLYTYKKYTDVRLVFAPEYAIAFFGGDPGQLRVPALRPRRRLLPRLRGRQAGEARALLAVGRGRDEGGRPGVRRRGIRVRPRD